MQKDKNTNSGFTLVEVMVAVLVLSVGLLGFAALQTRGLRLNHDALIRTQATFLANDIMDRMRTYDVATVGAFSATASGEDCDPAVSTITNDLNCWGELVSAALPSGTGAITLISGTQYLVTLSWSDRESAGTKTQVWEVEL